jgi:hypothetical protein
MVSSVIFISKRKKKERNKDRNKREKKETERWNEQHKPLWCFKGVV